MFNKYLWRGIREGGGKGIRREGSRQAEWRWWEPQGTLGTFHQMVAVVDFSASEAPGGRGERS